MEVFGGFMMVVSILFFFLAVIWFILPFIIFAIKGKVDRSVDQLAEIERRLASLEGQLARLTAPKECTSGAPPHTPAAGTGEQDSAPSPADPTPT